MNNEEWLIVDTETDGLYPPIHVVEIAAQRMCGWNPVGETFRVLLNHDVRIEPAAEAVHGYSQEYLREHGADPLEAHHMFHEYAGDLPIVAYNLSFDWDRALLPEYSRLQLPPTGNKGFCALTLARRIIPEAENYKLETLKLMFTINTGASHRGRNDVATLVELMTRVIKPRLLNGGITGFSSVKEFSRRTPVAKCLDMIRSGTTEKPEWYVQTEDDKQAGPYSVAQIRSFIGNNPCFAWRPGMAEWASTDQLPEFAVAEGPKRKKKARQPKPPKELPTRAKEYKATVEAIKQEVAELVGICKGITSDGLISAQEFILLRDWLMNCRHFNIYPMNVIAEKVEAIAEDGLFTSKEHEELFLFLQDKLKAFTD
jgi:DNA polymerase III epsilon subunit-like protein